MSEKKEKNFYAKIPGSIMLVLREKLVTDKKIKTPVPYGKILVVGAIIGLSRKKGYCYAENSKLATLLAMKVGTLKNYLTSLERDGIIYRYYSNDERRLKINQSLVLQYPEIRDDIYNSMTDESQAVTDESQAVTDESQAVTDESQAVTDESQVMTYPYYIYKLNESITKIKENKNKNFWLVNFEDESFKKWLEKNPLDYKQSEKQAFDLISDFYPFKSKTKEAREAFSKLDKNELIELFESMPMLLDHVAKQKHKNLLANEHEFKYIQKFVNYISQKSFKNYQKKFQKEQFGIEEFEAFLDRIEDYAYEMSPDGFFIPSPKDEIYDYNKLKVIVWNYKKGKTIEELRPFCQMLTGFKEEIVA